MTPTEIMKRLEAGETGRELDAHLLRVTLLQQHPSKELIAESEGIMSDDILSVGLLAGFLDELHSLNDDENRCVRIDQIKAHDITLRTENARLKAEVERLREGVRVAISQAECNDPDDSLTIGYMTATLESALKYAKKDARQALERTEDE